MQEILFISHRIPFPPDRGDKIRSFHVLKRLARLAPVHVATFADDDHDLAEEVELAAVSRSYRLVRRSKSLIVAGLQGLATRKPVSLPAFDDNELRQYIAEVLASRPISTIYIFSGQMGQYVPESFAGRVIVDFVDVDSAKFEAYAAKRGGVIGWVENREARLLRDEEARLARRAEASILISEEEAALFRSRLSSQELAAANVRVLGNGIDSLTFDPGLSAAEARMLDCTGPRMIFTGQMDYTPNVEAVIRAMDRILPLIRDELPDATFHVVGRNPTEALLERHGREGCYVWGRVNDMRPWLKAADLALIPLEIARGVQNKVLEAMAMTLPVVLTRGAATGIGARDSYEYAIADSDADLARRVVGLMRDRRGARTMGLNARHFVIEHASWPVALAPLVELAGVLPRPASHAA
jgi:sugar transferase (PEP-CTERM/EpsH1 system associated)